MAESSDAVRLINHSSLPVELHLASAVVVIGAHEELPCSPEDLDSPQLKVLADRGVLGIRRAPERADAEPPKTGRRRAGAKTGGSRAGKRRKTS
jgi:hypothetical protein